MIRELVRQMPAGVMLAEAPSGRIILSNDLAERLMPCPAVSAAIEQALTSGEAVSNEEVEIERSDGTHINLILNCAPIRDVGGFVSSVLCTLQDVSRLKTLDEQVRQSQRLDVARRLAGGVAHDFNNLLTIITGYGQSVLESLEPASPLRHDIETILEASGRAAGLTRELLNFSRRQALQPKVVDVNEQISLIARILRRVIREDIELKEELGPVHRRVRIDPGQLDQVMMNLAANARDAMPGGGKLTIRTAEAEGGGELPPGKFVLVEVADTGKGMDARTLSHVFEPFFTTKERGKGTGLGLSTVQSIVKQCGGEVEVKSEPGRGTSIRVYLPAEGHKLKAGRTSAASQPTASRGTGTILLVEDDPGVRRLTAGMLQRLGYTVLEAASGEDAVRIWTKRRDGIDMVLTDVVMPRMSGAQLAARLRSSDPNVKVLYMTGHSGEVLAGHGVPLQGTTILEKPFTLDVLSRKIRAVLDEAKKKAS